jgi:CBS domain-containing protein
MLVSQVLRAKGDLVFTASPRDCVDAVASMLNTRRVGAIVVVDGDRDVVGIVSERDVVRIVAERGASGLAAPVTDCMTQDVVFAKPTETVDAILARMTDRRVRHLPVCADARLVGIVSIGDLVKAKIAETEAEAESLRAYIAAA